MPETPRAVRRRVGRIVKQLRLLRGLTQERLAELAGDAPTHLGMVERGQVNVSIDILTRIAASLAVPVAELFRTRSGTGRIYVITQRDMDHLVQALRSVDRVRRERGTRKKSG
jgi:transcriptional regulator with XRE-family HTH domain